MSKQTEQVKRLRNRHVARLLTNLSEIGQLPKVTENEIKREFSFFADDVIEQVMRNTQGGQYDHEETSERDKNFNQ